MENRIYYALLLMLAANTLYSASSFARPGAALNCDGTNDVVTCPVKS